MKRVLFFPALLALACSNPTPTAPPAAFDRPEDVAFFCWNLTTNSVTALADCRPPTPSSVDDDDGEPPVGYALHALVTQTTTGEVAAARITGTDGEPGVIDTDVRIPGYTFAAVGDVPSALAVSRIDPQNVFVLSRGSADVSVIHTADFRRGLGAGSTAFPLPGDRPLPSAMRLTPDEDALLVALPETGQLARIPVSGETLGDATLLDLVATLPDPVDLRMVAAESLPPRWLYTCDAPSLYEPPIIAPRDPVSLEVLPGPAAMIEDPITREIIVADGALPLLHVIDPVSFTETLTIGISVPVRALALTPLVPATIESTTPTERYLYAVDATDGSILAIDWSDRARPTFGAVLPVEVQPPYDRLNVPFPARALAVVSPSYDADEPIVACADAQDGGYASGVNLHGVFLAVGTVDGRVRFYDVFDEDTECRGYDCGGGRDLDVEDQIVAIGRHRPRLGAYMSVGVSLDPSPTWDTDSVGVELVTDSGVTGAPDLVPVLTPVTCDAPLDSLFPEEGTPLVCAVRDPWAAISQSFIATFEGAIPFTSTTGANFEDGGLTLVTHTDYCSVGVIGSLDVPTDGGAYLGGYAGDVVAVTGDLPPSILSTTDEALLNRCNALTERTTGGDITPVLIQIEHVESHPDDIHSSYVGRLRLREALIRPATATVADVLECYPELLEMEVRSQNSFVVTAGRRGFQHPIVEGASHFCEVDAARADALQRGRAFFDSVFQTTEVTFALGARPGDITGRHPELQMTVADVPTGLNVDISTVGGTSGASLLTRLVYNDVDDRLYAVDQSVQGLLRLKLSRLSVQQTFR
ncbi:MAG: hypothetical protein H6719_01505 [Sandaracinaceae bacterium]|nr:hypothetical protein [Sandaracinaceae bacterium]